MASMSDTESKEENTKRRLRGGAEKCLEDVPIDIKLPLIYENSDDDFEPSKKVKTGCVISRPYRYPSIDSVSHQIPRLSPSLPDEPKFEICVTAEITIPGVRAVPQPLRDDEKHDTSNLDIAVFKRRSAYIRYTHPTEEELDSKNMYDVDRFVIHSSA
jgi:hypothetical protein